MESENKKEIEVEILGMGELKFQNLRDDNKTNNNLMPIKNSKYIKTITYTELEKLLDNNYILSLLKKRRRIKIFSANSINLISKYRYDVFIKYYYVKAYSENKEYDLAKYIYINHIGSFNNFIEPDERKKGKNEFINRFNELIYDIKINGIDKTIIPITKNGEIIDGAHRLAIALYLNLNIQFAIFDLLDANYNKEFFIKRGFRKEYAEIIDEEVVKKLNEK